MVFQRKPLEGMAQGASAAADVAGAAVPGMAGPAALFRAALRTMGYGQGQQAVRPQARPAAEATAAPARATEGPLNSFPGFDRDWHAEHDAMIRRVVARFNQAKGWDARHPHYLDPNLVKAWALQESGGHEAIFRRGDMMQVNNNGDWVQDKNRYLGLERGQQLNPEESLYNALHWAYYKGETTAAMAPGENLAGTGWYPTERGTERVRVPGYKSRFVGWETALRNYNGGGVSDYWESISARYAAGR